MSLAQYQQELHNGEIVAITCSIEESSHGKPWINVREEIEKVCQHPPGGLDKHLEFRALSFKMSTMYDAYPHGSREIEIETEFTVTYHVIQNPLWVYVVVSALALSLLSLSITITFVAGVVLVREMGKQASGIGFWTIGVLAALWIGGVIGTRAT